MIRTLKDAVTKNGINFVLATDDDLNKLIDAGNDAEIYFLSALPEVNIDAVDDFGNVLNKRKDIYFFLGYYDKFKQQAKYINDLGDVPDMIDNLENFLIEILKDFQANCHYTLANVNYIVSLNDYDFNLSGLKGKLTIKEV